MEEFNFFRRTLLETLSELIEKHVRAIHFNYSITSDLLEVMVCNINWRSVTHLILYDEYRFRRLLRIAVDTMPRLQYLAMKLSFNRYNNYNMYYVGVKNTVELLEIISTRIKVLKLDLPSSTDLESVVAGIQVFVNKHYADALPSLIKIFGGFNITATDNSACDNTSDNINYGQRNRQSPDISLCLLANATDNLFKFWSKSAFSLSPFVIQLYDKVPSDDTPIHLFPPVPMRSYKFGPAATPTLIQLPGYGIVGLKDNIFHFSEYIDDHGMVSHAVTLDHGDCGSLIEERHISYLYSSFTYSLLR